MARNIELCFGFTVLINYIFTVQGFPIHLANEGNHFVKLESEQPQPKQIQTLKGRSNRQVVQPTWLTPGSGFSFTTVDPLVRVNEKNLQETAEIRKEIQAAINEGRYAVNTDGSFGPAAFANMQQPAFGQQQWPQWNSEVPQWNFQMPQWNFQTPQWNMQPSQVDWSAVQAVTQQYFEELQKQWVEQLGKWQEAFNRNG